jgi:hypothetical protein
MATIAQTDDGQWAVTGWNGTVLFHDKKMAEAYVEALSKTPAESAQILDDLADGLNP